MRFITTFFYSDVNPLALFCLGLIGFALIPKQAIATTPEPYKIEMQAWVGKSDTELTFSDVSGKVELYRSSEDNCDIDNYSACEDGQLDRISDQPISDTALLSQQVGYYTFATGDITTSTMVSSERFSERSNHQMVVFKDRIWIIAGHRGGDRSNDIWSSSDAVNWRQELAEAPFSERDAHQVVAFKKKLWLIGGFNTSVGYLSDMWSSEDGINWVQETADTPFPARARHQLIVFDNKIWVIGGRGGSGDTYFNDIWSSTDGVNWVEETPAAEFSPRSGHQVALFNNKLYLVGGYDKESRTRSDVWSSENGIDWTLITESAQFDMRLGFRLFVYADKLWVTGGRDYNRTYFQTHSSKYFNDIWSSTDGENWILESESAEFSPRYRHQIVKFQDQVILTAGFDRSSQNDSWVTDSGTKWRQLSNNPAFNERINTHLMSFKEQLWLIAGSDYNKDFNDSWSSSDGEQWILEHDEQTLFLPSKRAQITEFNNKLWLTGGYDTPPASTAYLTTTDAYYTRSYDIILSSADGKEWKISDTSPSYGLRSSHQTVSFNGKLWLIGGLLQQYNEEEYKEEYIYKNDVWSSLDGENWELETDSAGFTPRYGHRVTVFQGQLWLVGGYDGEYRSDVWSSDDGINWRKRNDIQGLGKGRYEHQLVEFNERLWIIGGVSAEKYHNDIWSSANGVDWQKDLDSAAFQPRYGHSVTRFQDQLWLTGGYDGTDVRGGLWKSNDGINWYKSYQHDITLPTAPVSSDSKSGGAITTWFYLLISVLVFVLRQSGRVKKLPAKA